MQQDIEAVGPHDLGGKLALLAGIHHAIGHIEQMAKAAPNAATATFVASPTPKRTRNSENMPRPEWSGKNR